uniref:Translin-associated factor X-interacting protein 1 N-terminal domain-containing protein n=1 Tax=Monopterus albus TaxID=43700 RepID=A0A3Q3JWS6_MONAL
GSLQTANTSVVRSTPDILISDTDERFFQSLYEFIEHEKRYLRCPEEGPSEQRHSIYCSVFNKVFTKIMSQHNGSWQPVVHTASSLLKHLCCLPGLTVAESLDPEALDGHLKHLEAQRSALLDRKRHCVSLEVKAELDDMLQATAHHRDQLSTENNRLKVLVTSKTCSVSSLSLVLPGVKGPPGSVPPVLLFFQALLITAPAGDELSALLSLQAVRFALQHGASQLVTHAVTQKKLNFSEDLGDILTEHAQKNPGVTDLCLALATIVYEACGLDRKTALSMCKRGLIHSAIEFMNHCKNLTAGLCSFCCVIYSMSMNAELNSMFTAHISVLLEVLEEVILEDCSSSVDVWANVASLCSQLDRADLSRAILCLLLDQSGTSLLSPDLEEAWLMEHVFL